MPDRDLRPRRRIFVIGPMGEVDKPSPKIEQLKKVLGTIVAEKPDINCTIGIPQTEYSNDIPTGVFGEIDLSDLIVADISTRSPCVIYELGFAHCLGIPTILIDDEANYASKNGAIFYFSQLRIIRLTSRSDDAIREPLSPRVLEWLDRGARAMDPITTFYGISLIDVSAIAGIAVGYAENFLKPVMKAIGNKYRQHKYVQPDKCPYPGKCSHTDACPQRDKCLQPVDVTLPYAVVVVLPDNLNGYMTFQGHVEDQLKIKFADAVDARLSLIVSPNKRDTRTVLYYISGAFGVIIDIPRTVYPLRRSARVKRLADSHQFEEARQIEAKLLERFKPALLKVTDFGDEDIQEERLHVVTLTELLPCVEALVHHGKWVRPGEINS